MTLKNRGVCKVANWTLQYYAPQQRRSLQTDAGAYQADPADDGDDLLSGIELENLYQRETDGDR